MAETLLFNIPTPGTNQDIPVSVNWYQSEDGFNWGAPVDTILISNLPIDTATGKYIWSSNLANSHKYNELKTIGLNNIESATGFILPPRPLSSVDVTPSNIYAERIEISNGAYNIGETIELVLDLEEEAADFIGPNINVFIEDNFGNVVTEVTATRVGESIYAASWKIPKGLHRLYNISNEEDSDQIFYTLHDKWILPENTYIQFDFKVYKKVEEAVIENCVFTIEVDSIESASLELSEPYKFTFCSGIKPYYSTVEEVRSTALDNLSAIDDITLARDILLLSKQIDLQMKPDKIYHQEQYDFAVRMFIKYSVARNHLAFLLNNNDESKEIDNLKYTRKSGDPKAVLEHIDKLITQYAHVILAGGKDTPFVPKTFQKGIFDPNRTEANRASLDISDEYPYVNSTTRNSLVNINGNMVELRGTRTVVFLRNRMTSYSRTEGPIYD